MAITSISDANRLFIGIDCGKQGAIAWISGDGLIVRALHTPVNVTRTKRARKKTAAGKPSVSTHTEYDLLGMLSAVEAIAECSAYGLIAAVEQQHGMPHDSKHVVFEVGRGQGLWQMALATFGITTYLVRPAQWKAAYVPKGADKQQSVAVCRQLYPQLALPQKKDEALAEAVLIADWLKNNYLALAKAGK